MEKKKLPPPWVIMLFGGICIFWSCQHYIELAAFDAGETERMWMLTIMSALYEVVGFWPTTILPIVCSVAITLTGLALQIRDVRARATGDTVPNDYEPVRVKGLLTAALLAMAVIAAVFGMLFLIRRR